MLGFMEHLGYRVLQLSPSELGEHTLGSLQTRVSGYRMQQDQADVRNLRIVNTLRRVNAAEPKKVKDITLEDLRGVRKSKGPTVGSDEWKERQRSYQRFYDEITQIRARGSA